MASYNNISMQTVENQFKALEKKIDYHEKNSKNKTDNIIKTLFDMSNSVITMGFQFIYDMTIFQNRYIH